MGLGWPPPGPFGLAPTPLLSITPTANISEKENSRGTFPAVFHAVSVYRLLAGEMLKPILQIQLGSRSYTSGALPATCHWPC